MVGLGSWLQVDVAGTVWFIPDVLKCFWKEKQKRERVVGGELSQQGASPTAAGGGEDLSVEKQQGRAKNRTARKHQVNPKK